MKAVRRVKCPVIVAHSRDGEMIPYAMGRRLFDAAPEPKRFVELHGGRNERGLGYASESLRLIVDAVTEGIPAPVRAPEPKPDPRLTIGRDTVDPCADCCLSAHREVRPPIVVLYRLDMSVMGGRGSSRAVPAQRA